MLSSQITLTLALTLIFVQVSSGLTSETDLYKYTVIEGDDNGGEVKSEENYELESEHKQEAVVNKTVDYGESDLDANKNTAQSDSNTNKNKEDFMEYFNTAKSHKKKPGSRLAYKNIRLKSRKFNNTRVYKRLQSLYKTNSSEDFYDDTISLVNSLGGFGRKINVTTTHSPITENYRGNKQRLVTTQDVLNINEVINRHVQIHETETTSFTPAIVSEYGHSTTQSLNRENVEIVTPIPLFIPENLNSFLPIPPVAEIQNETSFLLPITTEASLQPLTVPNSDLNQLEIRTEPIRTTYLPFDENKPIDVFLQEFNNELPRFAHFTRNEPDSSNSVDENDQNEAEGQLRPQIQLAPTEKPSPQNEIQTPAYFEPQTEKTSQVEVQKSIERPLEYYFPQNTHEVKPSEPVQVHVNVEQRLPAQFIANSLIYENQHYPLQQTFYLPLELPKTIPIHYFNKPYIVQQPYHVPVSPTIKLPILHQVSSEVHSSYQPPVELPKFLRPYPMQLNHNSKPHHQVKNYREPYYSHKQPSCAELKFMGIYKSYCARNVNHNYIGLVPPKHTPYYFPRYTHTNVTSVKNRKARQNFESSIRMEYGFMPPLIPSLRIDEHGIPLEDQT